MHAHREPRGHLTFTQQLHTLPAVSDEAARLEARGLIRHGRQGVQLLGEGEVPTGLTVSVHKISAGARKKIEEAGGTVVVIE